MGSTVSSILESTPDSTHSSLHEPSNTVLDDSAAIGQQRLDAFMSAQCTQPFNSYAQETGSQQPGQQQGPQNRHAQLASHGKPNYNGHDTTGISGTTAFQSSLQKPEGTQIQNGPRVQDGSWRTPNPALLAAPPQIPPLPAILTKANMIWRNELQTGSTDKIQTFKQEEIEEAMNMRFHPECMFPEMLYRWAAGSRGFLLYFDHQTKIWARSKLYTTLPKDKDIILEKMDSLGIITLDDLDKECFTICAKPSDFMAAMIGPGTTEQLYASILTPYPKEISSCNERAINWPRLLEILRDNRSRIAKNADPIEGDYEGIYREPEVRFMNEILYRCIYINAFLKTKRYIVEKESQCTYFNRYYPAFGPNVELDCWIYEQGILQDPQSAKEHFNHLDNDLIRMYGFATVDLRFLQNNHHADERREQLRTLESYHILKIWLQDEDLKDVAEQMRFCYYAMRDSKNWPSMAQADQDKTSPPGKNNHRNPDRLASVKARKREFKIAKIMVNRAWKEYTANGKRISPIELRQKTLEQMSSRKGDWDKLSMEERTRLLGGPTMYHPKAHDFDDLAKEWLWPRVSPPRAQARAPPRGVPQPSSISPFGMQELHRSLGPSNPPVYGGNAWRASGPLEAATYAERSQQIQAMSTRNVQQTFTNSYALPARPSAPGPRPQIRAGGGFDDPAVRTEAATTPQSGYGHSSAAPRTAALSRPCHKPTRLWAAVPTTQSAPTYQNLSGSGYGSAAASAAGRFQSPSCIPMTPWGRFSAMPSASARQQQPSSRPQPTGGAAQYQTTTGEPASVQNLTRVSRFFPGTQRSEAAQGRPTANWVPGPDDFEMDSEGNE
jgi:hypothetical protein